MIGSNTLVVVLGAAFLGMAAGAVGVFAMLRGRTLMADALAHATLPGVAGAFLVATALGAAPRQAWALSLGAAIAAGLALLAIEWLGRKPRVGPDAATAAVLAAGFGVGLSLLSIVQTLAVGRQAGLETLLFGSAAGMLENEAWLMLALALVALTVTAAFLKQFAAAAFDPDFARAAGLPVERLDSLVAILSLVMIVAALPVTGLVLAVALLVIPPAAARFWSDRVGVVVALAAAIGAAAAVGGALASASLADTPTGPAIVLAATGVFLVSLFFGSARGLLVASGRP